MSDEQKTQNDPTEYIELGRTIPMPSDRIKPSTPPPSKKDK